MPFEAGARLGPYEILEHVLRRSLEKNPERRWQNIGDVGGELRWIGENPGAPAVATASADRSGRVGRLAIVATVAFVLKRTLLKNLLLS